MIKNRGNGLWRQSHRGLVENKQARIGHQRTTDGEHLLFTAGKGASELTSPFCEARKLLINSFDGFALQRG